MKRFLFLAAVSLVACTALAIEREHPATHYTNGVGIEYHKDPNEYIKDYVGKHLIYFEAKFLTQGDKRFKKKFAGTFRDASYLLTSITIKGDVMKFTLVNEETGETIIIPVINKDEWGDGGDNTYCISPEYSLPFVVKENFDDLRRKSIGRCVKGDNATFTVKDVVMDYDKNYHMAYNYYPNVCFIVTNDTTNEERRVFDLSRLSVPTVAQIEPDYVGEIWFMNSDSTITELEKKVAQVSRESSGSWLWIGGRRSKDYLRIPNEHSPVAFYSNEDIQFIVRGVDNDTDPFQVISIFEYEEESRDRVVKMGEANHTYGSSSAGIEQSPIEVKKFGEHSYLVKMQKKEEGEYGIMYTNPITSNGLSNIVIYSFGIKAAED